MYVKQGSAGVLCRCLHCHGIFLLFRYYHKKNAVYSEFECKCGRIIKIKEIRQQENKSNTDDANVFTGS